MQVAFRHFHICAGLGGAAIGLNAAFARLGSDTATFECIGGVDIDPAANADFQRLAKAPATQLDLMDRQQYVDFHGQEPPAHWREAGAQDIRDAAGGRVPNCVVISAPCKGLSPLLNQTKSLTRKYKALNKLSLRALWLTLEAFVDDLPEYIAFENVPGLQTRGKDLVSQIVSLLHAYGYATSERSHDCGTIAGLAQSRKRFLLLARNTAKVPGLLYEPATRRLRGVGEVLGMLPVPVDGAGGELHRLPRLQWRTWVRLACVQPGGDWRSLRRLAVNAHGELADLLMVPDMHAGVLGVTGWQQPIGVVTGASRAYTGAFAVADPRVRDDLACYQQYGVCRWDESMGAITGQSSVGGGTFCVADPRAVAAQQAQPGRWRIVEAAGAAQARRAGAQGQGGPAIALPEADQRGEAVILTPEGNWHRPITTLEMAALQSLFDPSDPAEAAAFGLSGASDEARRERIGNAIPSAAMREIGNMLLMSLLGARAGETFSLSALPVWVRPQAVSLALASVPAGLKRGMPEQLRGRAR